MRIRPLRAARAGFTLVELLVVIVIIGLLATAVVTNYDKIFPAAKKARVQTDLMAIRQAIQMFKTNNASKLPESLERLVEADENGVRYLENWTTTPRDPWDNEYYYSPSSNGMTYELMSYGADGAQGGEGENEDLDITKFTAQKDKK
jgi:general secretion pathway protein G